MTEVTIGMPVYNNGRTLQRAIDSLLAQTFPASKIIISDDCSTDDTESIGRAYARADHRIEYFRQNQNLGYQNFRYVLEKATTPFFMWAAGDDYWYPEFIAANLDFLRSNPSFVASISKVIFVRETQHNFLSGGTYPLVGDVKHNIACYLSAPQDNSRMYGLFRTEVLKKSFPKKSFHAYDWGLCAATLVYGKHNELPETLMLRDYTPPSRYVHLVQKDHTNPVLRLFPLAAMTFWLIFTARIPLSRRIISALFSLNLEKHWEYCATFHPTYFRWTARGRILWNRYIDWRLKTYCVPIENKGVKNA